jgi:hypothetical protein
MGRKGEAGRTAASDMNEGSFLLASTASVPPQARKGEVGTDLPKRQPARHAQRQSDSLDAECPRTEVAANDEAGENGLFRSGCQHEHGGWENGRAYLDFGNT